MNSIPGWPSGCHTSTPNSEILGALSGISRSEATLENEKRASLIRLPVKTLFSLRTTFCERILEKSFKVSKLLPSKPEASSKTLVM